MVDDRKMPMEDTVSFRVQKYENLEQKDPVLLDRENIKDVEIISNNYVTVENDYLRHDAVLLSFDIFKYLITKK